MFYTVTMRKVTRARTYFCFVFIVIVLAILILRSWMRKEEQRSYSDGDLWIFSDVGSIENFLYNQVITRGHYFNSTRTQIFRDELLSTVGGNFSTYLSVDQLNSPIGTEIKYNGKSSTDRFVVTRDIYERLIHNSTYNKMSRCSVVGNSGLLLHSNCGRSIDMADYIYRCNAAPINKFAGDAGTKSNFTTLNPSIFTTRYEIDSKPENIKNFFRDMKQYHGFLWAPCLSFSSQTVKCIEILKSYNVSKNQFVLGHPDHYVKIREYWKSRGIARPSSGFYLTNVALSHCQEVHLYGFWPFLERLDTKRHHLSYHYFDEITYNFEDRNTPHQMNQEFNILVQLHLLGILKLHVGQCDAFR